MANYYTIKYFRNADLLEFCHSKDAEITEIFRKGEITEDETYRMWAMVESLRSWMDDHKVEATF